VASFDIVIRATNATKAAFNEVGAQANALNKTLQKAGNLFRGLFVAGVVAKFAKELLEASTYGKELEEAGERVKSAWSGVTQKVGDGFAEMVMALEPIISKVGNFFSGVIDGLQKGAAYVVGLVTTGSHKKASKIANETVADLKKERQARIDAAAAEKRHVEVLKEKENDDKAVEKLRAEIAAKEKKRAEDQLSDEELLAKRRAELRSVDLEKFISTSETGRLAAINKELDLKKEIEGIQERINKRLAEAAEEQAKIADETAKEQHHKERVAFYADQTKKVEAKRGEVEGNVADLEKQAAEMGDKAEAFAAAAEKNRALALDKGLRKEEREREKSERRKQSRIDSLSASAERKMRRQVHMRGFRGSFGPQVTEAERLALQGEIDQRNKGIAEENKSKLESQMDVSKKQLDKLDSIDKQIKAALTYK
jgi:hypothetical protein